MGRPSNAEQRRGEIIAAFLAELGNRGYEATSMARLGERAGLRPSLMHYYFASKSDILLASVPVLEAAYAARRERYLAGALSPQQKLAALIDAHLALDAASDPAHVTAWIQLMALAQLAPAVGEAMKGVLAARHAELAACFDEDQTMRATGVLAAVLGMFQVAALRPDLVAKGGAGALVKGWFHA